ncbi:glycosyltransferase family 4 protein [Endothiovibrio diazotrophicus]
MNPRSNLQSNPGPALSTAAGEQGGPGGERPRVLLVGNYPPDRQISMARYAELLAEGLGERGWEVVSINPQACLNPFPDARRGIAKWLGYIDKFLCFPWRLRRQVARLADRPLVVHVCDHSNAPYLFHLGGVAATITCHDLLAVRAALGEFPERRTRWSGRLLQRAVAAGLARARHCICVSEATRRDVLRLTPLTETRVTVIPHALNYPFRPMPPAEARERLRGLAALDGVRAADGGSVPFLLHVGAEVWYKNRAGLLRIYRALRRLGGEVPPLLLVGAPLPGEARAWLAAEGLERWVLGVGQVDGETLRALYSRASALLFPSLEEGFGWPVLEAMACGCPVAASDRAPMSEVGGAAAVYFDPQDPAGAARVVARLLAEGGEARQRRIRDGIARAAAFSSASMFARYASVYRALAGAAEN